LYLQGNTMPMRVCCHNPKDLSPNKCFNYTALSDNFLCQDLEWMSLLQTWVQASVKCHGLLTPMLKQLVSGILPCVYLCLIEHCGVLISAPVFVSINVFLKI
jgi:hypothetical protein